MIDNKKVAVVLPAYNAALTLEKTYNEIPMDIVDEVILTDDKSSDATVSLARNLGINHIIVHEFAHKLDMLNGRGNGMPPLHPDMAIEDWTLSLSHAYNQLRSHLGHRRGAINAYAATDPAEFFAVICEYFFTAPDILIEHYPAVYEQLRAYFRQDTAANP